MTKCSTCGYVYDATKEKAVFEHKLAHAQFVQSLQSYNIQHKSELPEIFMPKHGDCLDDLKKRSYELRFETKKFTQLQEAARLVIEFYYNLSFTKAVHGGYVKEHPLLHDYLSMVFMHCRSEKVVDGVKVYWSLKYGLQSKDIAPGYYIWYPPDSDDRKQQFEEYQRDYAPTGEYRRPLSLLEAKARLNRRF